MINIKKIVSGFLILTTTILISCNKADNKQDVALDLFDVMEGRQLAQDYLKEIRNGNVSFAKNLCTPELIENTSDFSEGISNITGFQLDKSVIGNNFGYFIFNVVRDSSKEPKSDLEKYTIKVKRDGDDYKIDDVLAESQRELYIKDNALRIIGEKGGKSSLVISLNNIPKDTYIRKNKLMLYKDEVPNDDFGKVILGFTGQKVAVSTVKDNDSFICIVYIDEALMEDGSQMVSFGGATNGTQAPMADLIESAVSRQLVSVDLLEKTKIDDFVFSKDDDILAINYTKENGNQRANLYDTADGTMLKTRLKDYFEDDIYNIKVKYFENDSVIFNVYKSDNSIDDKTGEYNLDLESLEMIKL